MDASSWNRDALSHAPVSGAFLQSWQWGEFQRAVGREVQRFAHNGRVAQTVSRPMPGGFFGWDLYRAATDDALLAQITAELRKTKGVFLHVEPADDHGGATHELPLQLVPSRQPRHTAIMDLAPSEDALLAAMHHKTRYNIRLAQKHGVTVERQSPENGERLFEEFSGLLRETAARDRFHVHDAGYYRRMVETLAEPQPVVPDARPPHGLLFTARHGTDALASVLVLFFGDTVTYLHGASSDRKRELMAPHLLHWEIMRRAKERGYRWYDFWGVAPEDAPPSHPWTGITRFKMGFAPRRVTLPGAWELPLRPMWYRLYRLIKRPHS